MRTTTRDGEDNAVGYLGIETSSKGQYLGIGRAEESTEVVNEEMICQMKNVHTGGSRPRQLSFDILCNCQY